MRTERIKHIFERLNILRKINKLSAVAVLLLLIIGTLFVYSSGYSALQTVAPLYRKQFISVIIGLIVYIFFAVYDYTKLRKTGWLFYCISLILLVITLAWGTSVHGARRWLAILPGLIIQPSEIAKIAVILVLSERLSNYYGSTTNPIKIILIILGIILVPVLLILKQPNLSTALLFIPIAFIMLFVAGVPMRTLGILIGAGMLFMALFLGIVLLPNKLGASEETQIRIMKTFGLNRYQYKRVTGFLNPEKDPLGAGWNRIQSRLAVGSGRFWGKGFMKGTQNLLEFLPKTVAPTDFIFSVIAEESGFVGCITILILFAVLLISTIFIGLNASDRFGRLICTGVATLIFLHIFINIAMVIGMLPVAGLPLPLLSYGGSFIVIILAALGIVQSVHIHSQRAYNNETSDSINIGQYNFFSKL